MKCRLCVEGGQPSYFASPRRCAFEQHGEEFSSKNWNCVTAITLREFMGEAAWDEEDKVWNDGWWIRRNDQSYGALWVPPHPNDPEDVGVWRGGGLIAGYWYKGHGETDMLIRVDPRDRGRETEAAKRLTLQEAEAAIRNIRALAPSVGEPVAKPGDSAGTPNDEKKEG